MHGAPLPQSGQENVKNFDFGAIWSLGPTIIATGAPCIEKRGIEDNFIFYIECYFFFYSCKEIQVWI